MTVVTENGQDPASVLVEGSVEPEITQEINLEEHLGGNEGQEESEEGGEGIEEGQESESQEPQELTESEESDEEPAEGEEDDEDEGDEDEVEVEVEESDLDDEPEFSASLGRIQEFYAELTETEENARLKTGWEIFDCRANLVKKNRNFECHIVPRLAKKLGKSERTLFYFLELAKRVPKDDTDLCNALQQAKIGWRRLTQLFPCVKTPSEMSLLLEEEKNIGTMSGKEFKELLVNRYQINPQSDPSDPKPTLKEIEEGKKKFEALLQRITKAKSEDMVSKDNLEATIEILKENLPKIGEILNAADCNIVPEEQGAILTVTLAPDQCRQLRKLVELEWGESEEQGDDDGKGENS